MLPVEIARIGRLSLEDRGTSTAVGDFVWQRLTWRSEEGPVTLLSDGDFAGHGEFAERSTIARKTGKFPRIDTLGTTAKGRSPVYDPIPRPTSNRMIRCETFGTAP